MFLRKILTFFIAKSLFFIKYTVSCQYLRKYSLYINLVKRTRSLLEATKGTRNPNVQVVILQMRHMYVAGIRLAFH